MVEVHALASGSSGNAVLVKAGDRGLLIDAGLGPRTLLPALHRRDIGVDQLDAILLTHEHDDHLRGAAAASSRLRAPVVANRATLAAANARTELRRATEMETGSEARFGEFTVRSFGIDHDAAEPVGYVVEVRSTRITYATDVGRPCDRLREALRGAHLCILEANHDLAWLKRGPYPPHMKERVASDRGHLSNEDAAALLAERLDADGPAAIWLAHLSAVNNSPAFARRFVNTALQAATRVPFALDIALRDRPSVQWRPRQAAAQLTLF
jgi:phosphoribosyl 1,2-cyclic phosphodiesterase